ncbi:glycosyltransferase [Phenylobacterium sp.]|uniref:glycosyltransferase n=1 Tax=Phenylobacterium sp. TaxID=1871053 RepID=UPI003983C4CC
MRIFYVVSGDHVAGGQLVNLAHVTTLRTWGHDARLLIVRPPAEGDAPFQPAFPEGSEPPPWQRGAQGLAADDVVVVGEMFGQGALEVQDSPARKVIHNQNPFYIFEAFADAPSMRRWGASHMICASRFTADMALQAGWTGPTSVVRPGIDPIFHGDPDQPRTLAVAYMPRKRRMDARLIRGLLRSRRPDLTAIPWIELTNASRQDCARALKSAAVFLSLSYNEGLGLPPVEAMAGGALVVGFHGGGGREYATAENGDWFDDGKPVEVADALAAALDALVAGERFAGRRAAGVRTAQAFSQAAFETDLKAAWATILGA